MKQIEFEIDTKTGELKVHTRGFKGKSCLDVHKLIEALIGQAAETAYTPEFYQQATQQAKAGQ